MKLSKADHDFCLKACLDDRATIDEKNFLSFCASTFAANNDLTNDDYKKMQRLTGSLLTVDGSIFDRPYTT